MTGRNVFDIELARPPLVKWYAGSLRSRMWAVCPIGLFGASTGAAAALVAAGALGDRIGAVVSRGGRPDLAGEILPECQGADTLDRRRR